MLFFLFGLVTGGTVGVAFMCLLQMSRRSRDDMPGRAYEEVHSEKTASSGVDNSVKKA